VAARNTRLAAIAPKGPPRAHAHQSRAGRAGSGLADVAVSPTAPPPAATPASAACRVGRRPNEYSAAWAIMAARYSSTVTVSSASESAAIRCSFPQRPDPVPARPRWSTAGPPPAGGTPQRTRDDPTEAAHRPRQYYDR